MRLRYRTVLFHIEDGEDLRQHYQQLIDELVRQAQPSHSIARRTASWRPPTDLHETEDAYFVKVEIAGMAEEDIEVTLYEDAVVVSGVRADESLPAEGASFHEAQIRYGPFQAAIPLPSHIDRASAEARYANGFLRLRLPKKPPARLRVQSGEEIAAQPVAPTASLNAAPPRANVAQNGGNGHA
jgi:HSP20 family protein